MGRRNSDRAHAFWDTQPVPAMGSEFSQNSAPIQEVAGGVESVRKEGYPLPESFEWPPAM